MLSARFKYVRSKNQGFDSKALLLPYNLFDYMAPKSASCFWADSPK